MPKFFGSFFLFFLLFAQLPAQIMQDDTLPRISTFFGVGEDSLEFAGQSFLADVNRIQEISVFLVPAQPNGLVTFMLVPDNGNDEPDLNSPIWQSNPISPPASGGWHKEAGLNLQAFRGMKYWVLVSGYQIAGASGYAGIGEALAFSDSQQNMLFSDDDGVSWQTHTERMAMSVRGSICKTGVSIIPIADSLGICPGDSQRIECSPNNFFQYQWSNGSNSDTTLATEAGPLSILVTDNTGCIGTDTIEIIEFVVRVPDLGPDTLNLCEGTIASLFAGTGFDVYEWNTGDSVDIFFTDSTGNYVLTTTDENGCRAKDSTMVIFYPDPTADFGNDTAFCAGNSLVLDANGSGYQDWIWSNGATNPSITVTQSGEYFVSISNPYGCFGISDTINIEVWALPDTPTVNLVENLLVGSPAENHQWLLDGNPISGATDPNFLPDQSGIYQVIVYDSNSCSQTSLPFSLALESDQIRIPEGFSPNEDGLNDSFFIDRIFFFPDCELVIYNRWGNEVFRKRGYQNEWKGEDANGKMLVDGTYFYLLDLGNGSPPFQGPVMIKR